MSLATQPAEEVSDGNNGSEGTNQDGLNASAEGPGVPKQAVDDLKELANKGLCAPLRLTKQQAQTVRVNIGQWILYWD